jgi:hypothetical protein
MTFCLWVSVGDQDPVSRDKHPWSAILLWLMVSYPDPGCGSCYFYVPETHIMYFTWCCWFLKIPEDCCCWGVGGCYWDIVHILYPCRWRLKQIYNQYNQYTLLARTLINSELDPRVSDPHSYPDTNPGYELLDPYPDSKFACGSGGQHWPTKIVKPADFSCF